MNILTIEQFASLATDNAKSGKWLSCTMPVEHKGVVHHVGIKSYGKWVQRIECCGISEGVAEQKTLKAMKAGIISTVESIFRSL